MTERREFLGALAALFVGVVLPEPVREAIWIPPDPCLEPFLRMVDGGVELNELIHQVFTGPVREALRRDGQFLRFFQEKPPVPSELPNKPIYFDVALR